VGSEYEVRLSAVSPAGYSETALIGRILVDPFKRAVTPLPGKSSSVTSHIELIYITEQKGVTGGCRKLHSEELHNLYSSTSIIRIIKSMRMRWAGHVARMGEKRNVYRLLIGKPEGKRPLGRPRRG
jgi:hypothetical protein